MSIDIKPGSDLNSINLGSNGTGTTKNQERRVFPFAVLPVLRELLDGQHDYGDRWEQETGQLIPWVFHRQGTPIRSYRRAWLSACKRAGIDRIPHDFRRTAVRNLERAGVPCSVAMQLVGHKTESIYTSLRDRR